MTGILEDMGAALPIHDSNDDSIENLENQLIVTVQQRDYLSVQNTLLLETMDIALTSLKESNTVSPVLEIYRDFCKIDIINLDQKVSKDEVSKLRNLISDELHVAELRDYIRIAMRLLILLVNSPKCSEVPAGYSHNITQSYTNILKKDVNGNPAS